MSPSLHTFFFFFFSTLMLLLPNPTLQTKTLLAPVSKDKHTNLFTLSAYLKTPLVPTRLYLDLSYIFSWTLCDSNNYNSSTYRHIHCDDGATFCNSLGFGGLACTNCTDTTLPDRNCVPTDFVCGTFPENPVTGESIAEDALVDTLALPNADDDSTHRHLVPLPNFTFSCARSSLVKGLPKGVTGLAALGRNKLSIQAQISQALNTSNSFAVCLPGSSNSTGVAFFGSNGPYYAFYHSSKIDLARLLIYTPLIVNPVASGDTQINYPDQPSNAYFIGLTSIRVNGKQVPVNGSLLTIDKESGFGGTKISTSTPYTLLESSVYKAVTKSFVKAASRDFLINVTSPVKPFSVCYDAKTVIQSDHEGPSVPAIDLVLDSKDVVWRIIGANSMVRVENKKKKLDLWCLGFVDGGVEMKTPIVIGGKQIEETLLQFDLDSNRLGFTSSLASRFLSCADFRVTDFAKHK